MKPKRKATPRQTSDRVSSAAGRAMENFARNGLEKNDVLMDGVTFMGISLRELRSICASCLNQDQTKGRRK